MENYSAIKKENNAICSNMDKTRDSHTKWGKSEREKQIPYDITYMWNLKYGTDVSTGQKQTHRHREQTCGCQRGERRKWDGWGVWGWLMQIMAFRMDKQWGPAVQHSKLYPISWARTWWKIIWDKECIYVWLAYFAIQQTLAQTVNQLTTL